jgi:hypothetical protein
MIILETFSFGLNLNVFENFKIQSYQQKISDLRIFHKNLENFKTINFLEGKKNFLGHVLAQLANLKSNVIHETFYINSIVNIGYQFL